MPKELPKKAKDLITKLQAYQQQLQNVVTQKRYLELQEGEIKNALKESKEAKGKVYKSVGPILIKSTKSKVRKGLKADQEIVKLRLSSLEKQEKKIRAVIKGLQEKLKQYIE